MTDTNPNQLTGPLARLRTRRGSMLAGAALIVLAAGAAAGAGGTKLAQTFSPQSVMLLQPAPIGDLKNDTPVAAKGEVAEIYANKFVVQDGSGRALVDLGPRGESGTVVTKGETVTVQGRFDRGVIRAQVLVHADGRTEGFGPPKPPHADRGPPKPPHADRGPPPPGPRADRGPERRPPPPGAERAPPPPPAADGAPPPPPPSSPPSPER